MRVISSRIQREMVLSLLCMGFTAARVFNSWGPSRPPRMFIASLCLVSVTMPAEREGAVHDMQASLFDSVLRHREVKSRALHTLGKQQGLHPRAMLSAQKVHLQVKTVPPRNFWRFGPLFTTK